jgi:hypothetical protein
MKEFKSIVNEYRKIDFSQRKAALATVVKVRGSSYRSPGARMLIMDDGKWVGSISGGCLEGDALRKARQVMTDKVPYTVTYDTREESNQNLGIGRVQWSDRCTYRAIDSMMQIIHFFLKVSFLNTPVALATVFQVRKN